MSRSDRRPIKPGQFIPSRIDLAYRAKLQTTISYLRSIEANLLTYPTMVDIDVINKDTLRGTHHYGDMTLELTIKVVDQGDSDEVVSFDVRMPHGPVKVV